MSDLDLAKEETILILKKLNKYNIKYRYYYAPYMMRSRYEIMIYPKPKKLINYVLYNYLFRGPAWNEKCVVYFGDKSIDPTGHKQTEDGEFYFNWDRGGISKYKIYRKELK